MLESRKDFGMRPVDALPLDFEKNRPRYEHLNDPAINADLRAIDMIRAYQKTGSGHSDDPKEIERLQQNIEKRFREIAA